MMSCDFILNISFYYVHIYAHVRFIRAIIKRYKVRYFWSSAYRIALTPISTLRYDTHISREITQFHLTYINTISIWHLKSL